MLKLNLGKGHRVTSMGNRVTSMGTMVASSPGLPMFFNVTREKSGTPGRFCDVIITYLPPFYRPRHIAW